MRSVEHGTPPNSMMGASWNNTVILKPIMKEAQSTLPAQMESKASMELTEMPLFSTWEMKKLILRLLTSLTPPILSSRAKKEVELVGSGHSLVLTATTKLFLVLSWKTELQREENSHSELNCLLPKELSAQSSLPSSQHGRSNLVALMILKRSLLELYDGWIYTIIKWMKY